MFRLRSGNKSQLWLRPLDSPAAQALPGTEGGFDTFWSPDSRSIAFFADQKLKRTDLPDGAPTPLADAPLGYGEAWSASGVIVFAPAAFRGLVQIPATGGTPAPFSFGQGADPGVRLAAAGEEIAGRTGGKTAGVTSAFNGAGKTARVDKRSA